MLGPTAARGSFCFSERCGALFGKRSNGTTSSQDITSENTYYNIFLRTDLKQPEGNRH